MTEMTDLERGRIAALKREIIQDYELNNQTKKIFDFTVAQREDPSFIRVYYRPLVDRIWFSDPNHYPAYGSIGGTIARGEIDYLLSQIKQVVEISTVTESDFAMNWLRPVIAELIAQQNEISLVGSVENVYQKIIGQHEKWKASYDNGIGQFKIVVDGLDIPLYAVVKEIIGDNIVLLNKECCRVQFREFNYPDLLTMSTLYVEIKPYATDTQKMDILVHSTMKLDIRRREFVKIFSLGPPVGEPLIV